MKDGLTFKEVAEEIKSRINCIDYAQEMALIDHEDNNYMRAYSLAGGNNPTCFMIGKAQPDRFKDNKTGQYGDVIELCALLNHNGDKTEALNELIKKTGINVKWGHCNTSELLKKQLELPATVDYWHKQLLQNNEFLSYLGARLKSKAEMTIAELKLGYSVKQDRLVIPYFKNGKPVYYCTRLNPNYTPSKENPKYRKAKVADYGAQICWGLDTVNRKTPLIIAEGAFDAMTFYQEGYAVLSPITGTFSPEQEIEFLSCAKRVTRQKRDIILIFDSDEAGKSFTRKNSELLFNNHIPFKTATVPDGFKDVSEYYEANEEIKGILDTTQDGLKYLAESFKGDRQGFETFIKKACRFHSNVEIATIFNYLKEAEIFNSFWLKELEKECKRAPIETVICSELMKKHDLIYSEGSGFYEYEDKIWKLKTDIDVRAYISEIMGKFSTGNKSSSIIKLLADKCNSHIEFNKKPLMSFNNGTLELDTGILRMPKLADYITVKADYDYIPEAECPKWLEFLTEVTSGDLEKMLLLQEVAGYCLFTENSLQKCAYLIGDGGNGKSVYLNIIEALFGSKNISNVEMSQFTEQFNRIALKDSMINISSELKTNVKGAEAIFKKLTAGEAIDGCLKHKNIVTFKPRAKLIMSANEFIVVNDPSFALERRMNFVRFNERYVDYEPLDSHEHRADPDLTKKLMTELSGIFNWLYEGYKRLKTNNSFTTTAESKEVLREFREAIDPVTAFINNFNFDNYKDLSNNMAYTLYTGWANLEGYRYPVTATTFKRRFKNAFLKANPDWEAYRTANERGVRKRG